MAEKSDSSASPLPPAPLLPNFSTENETALPSQGGIEVVGIGKFGHDI